MAKAIWINEGDELDVARCRRFGVDTVFFSERTHEKRHLEYARANGFRVGLYSNPQWYNFPAPKDYRTYLNRRLIDRFGVTTEEVQCDVQINYEKHDPQWIIDFFYWWRRVRQKRDTSWTLEGFQGGWAAKACLHPNLAGTIFVPQAYDGSMNPWDSYSVVQDLVAWGVPFDRIVPFLDAADARRNTYLSPVFLYMQHRLPV